MARVAFIGLGVMGYPMAGHLARAGHEVVVFNRTTARAEAWCAEYGQSSAATPAEAARGTDLALICVGNDHDVTEVVLGSSGLLAAMDEGSILIDHTTASADLARQLAQLSAERGIGFVDAPVSGGQAGAEIGQLTIMCGCDDPATYERARGVITAYARACERLGDAGSGQLAKMANQIAIAGVLQGLAEAINFAQRAGLDIDQLIPVISKGAAGSWQMENRSASMARDEFDFGFAVQWMRKDLGIALDEAARNGARLPVSALIDQFYAQVIDRGGSRWDTGSLIHLLHHP